jgi:DNA-binding transcriptional MerR regulator
MSAPLSVRASIVRWSVRHSGAWTAPELAEALGISEATLRRLARAGIVEADATGTTFGAEAAARLERMLRLHDDVGVNLTGAAIILDLLDRLERG